ncbi:hypothetical protein NDU88_000606 [Pleurodeles waltl]|uniref:Uncharacterized protein n=1 Tax=Pleurodeles waltl TaxID=8319 RepID=A0AAV7LA99_PLEWA|nr:hypothetical protein NDU88_000606 [Pleurodeles waltl]
MVYRKTKLRDEVAALQERQLLMKEITESAVTRGYQMEAWCTTLAVRVAKRKSIQKPKMPSTVQVRALVRKQKSRQKPKMPSTVQVRALVCKQKSRQKPKIPSTVQVRTLVRKENWDPYTWDGTVLDNDDWNWEDEVEVRVTELGGVESGEGRVGERGRVMEVRPLVQNRSKGVNGGQIQNSRLVRDYTQSELLEIIRMFRQMPAEPLFKWLVRLWDTGEKDALQNPFTLGPITEGGPFELEIMVQDDVVMWSLWQRQGKKRVPQDWALVETERITDDRPVTLKTWVPLLVRNPLVRCIGPKSINIWYMYGAVGSEAAPGGINAPENIEYMGLRKTAWFESSTVNSGKAVFGISHSEAPALGYLGNSEADQGPDLLEALE